MARLLDKIPRPSAEKLALFYGPSPVEEPAAEPAGAIQGSTHAATEDATPAALAESMRRAFLRFSKSPAPVETARPEPKRAPAPEPEAAAKPADPYIERLNAEMAKGNNLMNAGLHRQAVVHFKNMQKKYPCDARITLKIGLAYKELREYAAAQEYIRKAVQQGMEGHRYASVLNDLKVAQARSYCPV